MLVAQVENDTLNNTAMLRASTGISECFPSAVQFVLCKLCELFIVVFLVRAQGWRKGQAYEGDGASGASLTACLADAFLLSFCCCCWLLCSTSMATAWTTARRPVASFQVT